MKKFLLLFLLVAVAQAEVKKVTTDQLVEILDDAKKNHKTVFVKVYAEWCGYCKKIKGDVEALANEHPDIVMVEIEGDKAKDYTQKHDVSGFPTFLIHKNGEEKASDKVVGANIEGLKAKLNQVSNKQMPKVEQPKEMPKKKMAKKPAMKPAATGARVVTHEELKKELNNAHGKVVVVKAYTEWCHFCKDVKDAYDNLANEFSDVIFLAVEGDKAKEYSEKNDVSGFPTFLIHTTTNDKATDKVMGANINGVKRKLNALSGKPAPVMVAQEPAPMPSKKMPMKQEKKQKRVKKVQQEQEKQEQGTGCKNAGCNACGDCGCN